MNNSPESSNPYEPQCPADRAALYFRSELDMPNALQLFEACSSALEEDVRSRQELAIAEGIPAFFSAFLPKSGGTYLHNRLLGLGAIEIFTHTQSPIDFTQAYLIEGWLRIFLKGGTACHSHMQPSPYNMRLIQKLNVEKIWIHLRDPRQAALSDYWHVRGLGQGAGKIAEERIALEADLQRLKRSTYETLGKLYVYDREFEDVIRSKFISTQQWCVRWMRVKRSYPELKLLFTTFESLIADTLVFQKKVFEFFDYNYPGLVFDEKSDNDRFRKGETDEWRKVYSPELQQWLRDNIDIELYSEMEWLVD